MGDFFFKLLWPSQKIWTLTKLFCPNFTRNLLKLQHIFKKCFLKMFLKILDEQKFNRDVLQFLTLLNRVKNWKGLLCARFQFVRRFCNITSSHHDFRPEVWAYWAPYQERMEFAYCTQVTAVIFHPICIGNYCLQPFWYSTHNNSYMGKYMELVWCT